MSSPTRTSSRLVYRGSLTLPDSHITLDGIAFSAMLTAQTTLLQNPLALALESLRGIAIRFVAVINLADVYYDTKSAPRIVLDIHPQAVLSTVYFQNIFCLRAEQTYSIGVQVALGDTDATNIIIYASSVEKDALQLLAARITPPPVLLPRPDDPTPRKPPILLHAKGRDLFPLKPQFKVPAVPVKTLRRKPSQVELEVAPTIERKNKDTVKGIVGKSIPAHLLPKTHAEYKEVFNWIYRGVCFAMRTDMKTKPVNEDTASRLARVHVGMYVQGADGRRGPL
ncbi:uncharacterized protein BT62DRAFT_939167 [Guyanagaster necrorhizus]|uniref:Sld7 C-terminal domain-containing protein n=1 Tax=Guyanagaster necrorhizus TaxID=856835 RepID=A0A9P7VET1_9AGAR|nr:uncharacterized protein BT62DRAFT_939167 [Guyanagaster necrorhizus MCA 3950]KAG7439225.1 hypothetical protein BT62DRAFT_939167 [Guyanagaster necrorhizus MCA 3950]